MATGRTGIRRGEELWTRVHSVVNLDERCFYFVIVLVER